MNIYQIEASNPRKACGLDGKCFRSAARAMLALHEQGFEYSSEAKLYHNGATEAWIVTRELVW